MSFGQRSRFLDYFLPYVPGKTILERLRSCGQPLPSFFAPECGGAFICGKCRVRVLSGDVPAHAADLRVLGAEETESGMRLACCAVPLTDCSVRICGGEEDSGEPCRPDGNSGAHAFAFSPDARSAGFPQDGYAAYVPAADVSAAAAELRKNVRSGDVLCAVDLGTTAVQYGLLDARSGETLASVSRVNPQRRYGSDVLSRVQAACSGYLSELSLCIRRELAGGIVSLCAAAGRDTSSLRGTAICANTVMAHLLLGLDCRTLGSAPFSSVQTDTAVTSARNLFRISAGDGADVFCDSPVFVPAGAGPFIGADVLGVFALPFFSSGENVFFIDVGTNAEMALSVPGGIFCASAAAGPAFEGGRISCGSAALPGADGGTRVRGMYGSLLVGALADALDAGRLTPEGEIVPAGTDSAASAAGGAELSVVSEGRTFHITQGDVRELQLASAAIRAAAETLFREAGVLPEAVSRVYVAGAFGSALDSDRAVRMGLFPAAFRGKIVPAGNTSLQAAAAFLRSAGFAVRMEEARKRCIVVSLADSAEFAEFFIRFISFPAPEK